MCCCGLLLLYLFSFRALYAAGVFLTSVKVLSSSTGCDYFSDSFPLASSFSVLTFMRDKKEL